MNVNKLVGSVTNCSVPIELNAEGGNVPIVPANMVWASDNLAVSGPLTTNPDGSMSFTGIAAGVCNITVSDSAFSITSPSNSATYSLDTTPTTITFTIS